MHDPDYYSFQWQLFVLENPQVAPLKSKSWRSFQALTTENSRLMELFLQQSCRQTLMSKDSFHQLLSFAQGRRERETLTYAVYRASGISATAAQKHLQMFIEDPHSHPSHTLLQLLSMDNVLSTLSESRWNWFHFVEQMEKLSPGSEGEDYGVLDDRLEQVYDEVISSDRLQLDAQILVKQSHDAYVYDRDVRLPNDLREADPLINL